MNHDQQEQGLLTSTASSEDEQMIDNHMSASPAGNNNGKNASLLRKVASLMGVVGIGMGAFGAHALQDTLAKNGTTAMWQTATNYQLFHAAAVLALAAAASSSPSSTEHITSKHMLAGKLMGIGNLFFSGSIYCLALDFGPKMILGPITPLGGLLMIAGWFVVGIV